MSWSHTRQLTSTLLVLPLLAGCLGASDEPASHDGSSPTSPPPGPSASARPAPPQPSRTPTTPPDEATTEPPRKGSTAKARDDRRGEPGAVSAARSDPDKPFGGMTLLIGSTNPLDRAEACAFVEAFTAQSPENVLADRQGAVTALAAFAHVAPRDLAGLALALQSETRGAAGDEQLDPQVRGLTSSMQQMCASSR